MKILIYANGEKRDEETIKFGGTLFKIVKPDVTVVSISKNGKVPYLQQKLHKKATDILKNCGIKLQIKIREGKTVEELLKEIKEGKYDLLVIGSRGYSEILVGVSEEIMDTVTQEVVQKAGCSLLVIKEPNPVNKVLICTDGSTSAEKAIHFWGELGLKSQARTNVLNIIPEIYSRFKEVLGPVDDSQLEILGTLPGKRTEYLYKAKNILAKYKIEAKVKLKEGRASEEILKEAEADYDLIIMGTGGRKGNKKSNLGRQTFDVLRKAKIPVLAIR